VRPIRLGLDSMLAAALAKVERAARIKA